MIKIMEIPNQVTPLKNDEEEKKEIINTYFKDTKPQLKKLKFTTPQGNTCECYINRKHNTLLGSMVITKINNTPTSQFIHGMPKLNYYHDYLAQLSANAENKENNITPHSYGRIVEKYDGTNICLYKLLDPDKGKVIEIIPKTRNMPLLSKEFQKLYDNVRNINLENYLHSNEETHTILLELWGKDNPHLIDYEQGKPLNLTLLALYDNEYKLHTQFNPRLKTRFSEILKTGIKEPKTIAWINFEKDTWKCNQHNFFENNQDIELSFQQTQNLRLENLLENLEDEYEKINKNHYKKYGSPALEGGIIQTKDQLGIYHLYKLKPKSIRESHTLTNGIPNNTIHKEVLKFFDDYGKTEATRIILEDTPTAVKYIQENLLEEYGEEYVFLSKTVHKIEKQLKKETEDKAFKEDLIKISEKITKTHPNITEPVEYMKIFAKEYPQYKKQSREIFNIFKEKQRKQ